MPIKPENRLRYPADWPEIRAAILARAGYRCEHPGCLARQYSVGIWHRPLDGDRDWKWFPIWGQNDNPRTYQEARQVAAELDHDRSEEGPKPLVIVLTVAHLDHQPENCDPENLRALCQRHHLAYDAKHHKNTAYRTRKAAMQTADLFEA